MADLLSQDEIDALLSADNEEKTKNSEAVSAAKAPDKAAASTIASLYDFKHPARIRLWQLRMLENIHENFARLLATTLSGTMHTVVDVETAFCDQTTYAEFIMSLSNPSCSYQFALGPGKSHAVIGFSMPLVFAFVDRVFGGGGTSQGMEERILTQLEMGVMSKIIRRVFEDLEATWDPFIETEISDVELEVNPEFLQITAPSETVILLAFEVNSPHASGLVNLCYPFFSLEPFLDNLSTKPNHPPNNKTRLDNRLRLGQMELPVHAQLGQSRLSLSQAQSLQVSDVLCLRQHKDDPILVYIGDKPKYWAHPFVGNNGAVMLKLAGEVRRS